MSIAQARDINHKKEYLIKLYPTYKNYINILSESMISKIYDASYLKNIDHIKEFKSIYMKGTRSPDWCKTIIIESESVLNNKVNTESSDLF